MNGSPACAKRSFGDDPPTGLPSYTRYLFGFALLNAVNFTIALGTPMVLTAKFLGAGESLVGILIALTPFLVVLQIPAAGYADSFGYKRLMTAGWNLRSFFLLLIALLPPLAGRINSTFLLAAMVVFIFAFNLIRGFASGAWLPWISSTIPPLQRGRFLGKEQVFMNTGVIGTLLLTGWFLGHSPPGWRYSLLMVLGWAAGLISVRFLNRAPDVKNSSSGKRRNGKETMEAARAIWKYKPFRNMTRFIALYNFSVASIPGFLVIFLRDQVRLGEGTVLFMGAMTTLGSMLVSPSLGILIDRFGSRPIMRMAGTSQLLLIAFWAATAMGTGLQHLFPIGAACLAVGMLSTANAVPQTRLLLASCPGNEITLSLAISQVVGSLSTGIAAVFWGVVLESLRLSGFAILPPFGFFFLVSLFLCLLSQILLGRIREPEALPASHLFVRIFWRWPIRVLSGIWIQLNQKDG